MMRMIVMLLSEEAAKLKWCPMARIERHGAGVNVGVFRDKNGHEIEDAASCIASDCAMWRIGDHPLRYGYCGLAGIPVAE